jgi:hypothetical protein
MFNKSQKERIIQVNVQQELKRESYKYMFNKSQKENHTSKCSTRARERIIQVNVQQEPERVKQVNVQQEPERESYK